MALLEEAARLLYREWFVRLRFPGHEHTRIMDGVPEGWTKPSQLAKSWTFTSAAGGDRMNRGEMKPRKGT